MTRLRLGVDARAFSSPAGGVRRYAWELYDAIARIDPSVEVIALGAAAGARLPDRAVPRSAVALPTNLGWMALSMPLAARGAALDVYHAPAYTAPLWGVHPQVLTIHDVSYERRPEWNAYRNDPLRRWFYRASALAADRIVTDSSFSRQEIVAAYGFPAERIHVVPLAAGDAFSPGACDPGALPPGVRRPYALHVGDLHVRRNLTTVLSAILALRRDDPRCQSLTFVCAGIDRGTGPALRAQAAAAGDPPALVLTGPIDERALVNLYRGAMMLAYPSRYEGFGLPILEAMRCGIPVVGANGSSIPELVADAGLLEDELDVDGWRSALQRVATNPAAAAALSAASRARAAQFSWTRTATETLAVFRAASVAGKAGSA